MMAAVRAMLGCIPADTGRDQWARVLMAVKSELGEAGFDMVDEWSRTARNYDPQALRDTWRSIKGNGGITGATLFHLAGQHGYNGAPPKPPTAQELAERRRRALEAEAEKTKRHAEAAGKALKVWKAGQAAGADHPYLARKGVPPTDTMREVGISQLKSILGYIPKSKGEELAGRVLAVPVKVGNTLTTCELVDQDGRKSAILNGRKSGGFWAAQPLPAGDGTGVTILVGEGAATVLSGREASGYCAVAALSCGNLEAVARDMRNRYPKARLVILADLGTGQQHAEHAAQSVGGLLAVPEFGPARGPKDTDFNDLARLQGLPEVKRCIEAARTTSMEQCSVALGEQAPSDAAVIHRLASLSPLDYDREREAAAKDLKVRTATLDKLVAAARKDEEQPAGLVFDDVEPWPEAVNPAALLTAVSATVRRFIVCSQETADAVALWAAMSWLIDVVQVAPLAVITAPEKRCGKSQLLFLLGRLVARPLTASNISPAALFRAIDAWKPTLLVDEADAFMRENEELRGLLNCGHTRDSAYIVRVVGEDFTPTKFNVWGAKALAGIGRMADTLMDRSITLELRRKLPHEEVDRLRHAEAGLFQTLSRKLARFADDAREAVRKARPDLPASLNDRAQDNWEPLLAIAEVAGGSWPALARSAALKLSGTESPLQSVGTELLGDIQEVFETKRIDRISTADLIAALCEDDEKPWATYNRGKSISPRQVASRLAEHGIRSNTIRVGVTTPKGYMRDQFEEVFARYLASSPSPSATPPQAAPDKDSPVADETQRCGNKILSATRNPAWDKGCGGVADRKGEPERRHEETKKVVRL